LSSITPIRSFTIHRQQNTNSEDLPVFFPFTTIHSHTSSTSSSQIAQHSLFRYSCKLSPQSSSPKFYILSDMAKSKLSQEERARRKREAAKFRQRRCRSKKKEEAELKKQQLQKKSKSKSTKCIARKSSPESVTRTIATSFVPIHQEPHTHSSQAKKITFLIPSSDSNTCMSPPLRSVSSTMPMVTPLAGDYIPQSNHLSLPQMSSLPKNTTIEIQNRTPTSTPPIDEEELKAVGAMLSLRHSPDQALREKITGKSPISFSARSIPDQSTGTFHVPLAIPGTSLPLLPKIQTPNTILNTSTTSFVGSNPYLHRDLTRQRGSTLMKNGRNLRPGVYFYHN